jgi:hypothetical protein
MRHHGQVPRSRPQRLGALRWPAPAGCCFRGLRRPIRLGTFVLVPVDEIRLPHDKLVSPETEHQGIIVRAVTSYSATYVRRMIRQPASDRQYPLQKLRRNPLRFNGSPLHPCGRAGAEVDRKLPLQSVSAQEGCRVFFPRSEANGKVAPFFSLDLTYRLWPGRIAPHALNGLTHAFGNEQKFSR